GLNLKGPLLFPPPEDLPPLSRPLCAEEWMLVKRLANEYGLEPEPWLPVQVIGTGPNINKAAETSFSRASELFGMSVDEVRNRVTMAGAVEIGRLPGVVQVTLPVPVKKMKELQLYEIAKKLYASPFD
ncbi:MAG: acetamidase, partial [Nitrososphaerota archaeon]